jgi:transaldolase
MLARYIDHMSVTGLTSNPTIYYRAIKNGASYEAALRKKKGDRRSPEKAFFDLALEDIARAAALFAPTHRRTDGVDGWVSLELSPLLAHDTGASIAAACNLHKQAGQPNLFIKIPGTKEGLPVIEEATFAGVPIDITLLFSREQYLKAANARLRGIERRIAAGLSARVDSVASVFISRWDTAVNDKVPERLRNQLGIAIAQRTYKAYRDVLASARWLRALNAGARPQRLLWASTGTKDLAARDDFYVEALAAPLTVNALPESTLRAFADHGGIRKTLAADGGDCEEVIAAFASSGIDVDALAAQLQEDGAESFVTSWKKLTAVIAAI